MSASNLLSILIVSLIVDFVETLQSRQHRQAPTMSIWYTIHIVILIVACLVLQIEAASDDSSIIARTTLMKQITKSLIQLRRRVAKAPTMSRWSKIHIVILIVVFLVHQIQAADDDMTMMNLSGNLAIMSNKAAKKTMKALTDGIPLPTRF
ncbi:hypothetical protein SeMB42_g01714 [Synchytrium endobioticum]|uniref:Transmembrane protein n=1 Tax=Synchytrium endobioticum TaxID=286115 RepID=A0A507DKP9_9FUNG|nr:hypothetical protein SeMB42_g01714 [Synchytrium endobioticum]